MKKFQFRFSVLLEFRKRIETQALVLFSDKQRKYQRELEKKSSLKEQLKLSLQRRENLGTQAISAISFRSEQEYIQGLKQKIIQNDQAIFRAYKELEKALKTLLNAKKRTKTIELLYEKDLNEFKRAFSKRAQKELDEIMLNRYEFKEGAS